MTRAAQILDSLQRSLSPQRSAAVLPGEAKSVRPLARPYKAGPWPSLWPSEFPWLFAVAGARLGRMAIRQTPWGFCR